ncbi:unnamed protein product [Absidia cylindrospora]
MNTTRHQQDDESNSETENNVLVLRSRAIKRNIPYRRATTTTTAVAKRRFYRGPPLPTELVVQVLQYVTQYQDLYSCSLVNKQFFAIANPLLWKSPKLNNKGILRYFLTRLPNPHQNQPASFSIGQHIRILALDDWFWTDTEFLKLLPHVPLLEELKIIYKRSRKRIITNASLQYLPGRCPHLTSLSITRRALSLHTISQLGHHCRQLKHLTLHFCGDLPPHTLALLKDCPLESLLLSFVNRNDSLNHRIVADLHLFDRLTHLVLWNTSMDLVRSLFPFALVSWPLLAKLLLRSCHHLTDATFIPFIQAHPHLEEIDLHDADFTDASLDVMADALPVLTRLNLAYNNQISGLGVRRFLLHSKCRPHLSLVTLQSCPNVSPSDFPTATSNRDYEIILDQPGIDALSHLD